MNDIILSNNKANCTEILLQVTAKVCGKPERWTLMATLPESRALLP